MRRSRSVVASLVLALAAGALSYVPGGGAPIPVAEAAGDVNPIAETGLYANWATKTLNPGWIEYEPKYPLWSDNTKKKRWLYLPPGSRIDTAMNHAWKFPVGTKLVKEFKTPDSTKYLEHRVIELRSADEVVIGTYAWNADQNNTVWSPRGVTATAGTTWDVPSTAECHMCHDGAGAQMILGLSAIQMPTALLTRLQNEGRFTTQQPSPTMANSYEFPGNAVQKAALGYLYANCQHCHNYAGAMGAAIGLNFMYHVGRDTVESTHAYMSAVNQPLEVWYNPPAGVTLRIKPGDPDHSGVLLRMQHRNANAASVANYQMPEIGSNVVDAAGVAAVREWIRTMRSPDAGALPRITAINDPNRPRKAGGSGTASATPDAGAGAGAAECRPIITEVHMESKVRGTADEYVEIKNPCLTRFTFDAQWKLVVNETLGPGDAVLKNLAGMIIEPGGFLVLRGAGSAPLPRLPGGSFDPVPNLIAPGTRLTGTRTNWDNKTISAKLLADVRVTSGALGSTSASVALIRGTTTVDSVAWGTPDVKAAARYVNGNVVQFPPAGYSVGRLPAQRMGADGVKFMVQPPTPGADF